MPSRPGPSRPAGSGPQSPQTPRTVSLVTLGCARNEVDSEELAARLTASGWDLTFSDAASVVLVNTCGFIRGGQVPAGGGQPRRELLGINLVARAAERDQADRPRRLRSGPGAP